MISLKTIQTTCTIFESNQARNFVFSRYSSCERMLYFIKTVQNVKKQKMYKSCSWSWVPLSNFLQNVLKSQVTALSKSLSPQKFIKMAGQSSCVGTVHSFETTFAVLPHAFHVICCTSSLRINKMPAMVDYIAYIGRIDIKCCNSIIRCPLIRVNDTTRFYIVLNQWQ